MSGSNFGHQSKEVVAIYHDYGYVIKGEFLVQRGVRKFRFSWNLVLVWAD